MKLIRLAMAAPVLFTLGVATAITTRAGEPSVLDATAVANPNGTYSISATIAHGDEGWKHYADAFEVLDGRGSILATRVLYHPHVDEQPFTRSIADVKVPVGLTQVTIRARDSVHGYGKRQFKLKLPPRR